MDLRYTPPPQIRSAVWLMLNLLSLQAGRLWDGLGLTRYTPLLPRHAMEQISRFLSQAEPVLRRCLWLCAAELGPLPAPSRLPAASPPNAPIRRQDEATRSAAQPRFRLFETATPRPGTVPPKPLRTTGPRIRFLDSDEIPDINEYPRAPHDILPAGHLVRRLMALEDAVENRRACIDRIRRRLGGPAPLIARVGKRLFRRGPLTPPQCGTARLLDAETQALQPYFNSS